MGEMRGSSARKFCVGRRGPGLHQEGEREIWGRHEQLKQEELVRCRGGGCSKKEKRRGISDEVKA